MKRKQKGKLNIDDLQVKSFSAILRKDQVRDALGGSTNPCNYNTEGCATLIGCQPTTGGTDSGTGMSQTACAENCGQWTWNTDDSGCC